MSAGNQLNVDDHAVATVIATVQQHIQTMQTDIQKVQQATWTSRPLSSRPAPRPS